MKKRGKLFVISGPSGTGKGTLIARLFEKRDGLSLSVSATSRAPREGEKNGVNYFFYTKEEFKQRIEKNEFLEHACFCENYYGTPKAYVEEKLENGINVILEIEVNGAMQIKNNCPDAVLIFILPPSEQELEKRLRGRNTETDEVIQNRLTAAKWEISMADNYKYKVVNDSIERAVEEIENIINEEENKQ